MWKSPGISPHLWRDDLVGFLLGCSFTFESALLDAHIPVRHIEEGVNVPMYLTNRPCRPAGRLKGNMVVSMRPIPADLVPKAVLTTGPLSRSTRSSGTYRLSRGSWHSRHRPAGFWRPRNHPPRRGTGLLGVRGHPPGGPSWRANPPLPSPTLRDTCLWEISRMEIWRFFSP